MVFVASASDGHNHSGWCCDGAAAVEDNMNNCAVAVAVAVDADNNQSVIHFVAMIGTH